MVWGWDVDLEAPLHISELNSTITFLSLIPRPWFRQVEFATDNKHTLVGYKDFYCCSKGGHECVLNEWSLNSRAYCWKAREQAQTVDLIIVFPSSDSHHHIFIIIFVSPYFHHHICIIVFAAPSCACQRFTIFKDYVCVKLWSMFLLHVGTLIILMLGYTARWWCEITDRSMIRISKSTSCLICYITMLVTIAKLLTDASNLLFPSSSLS